MESQSRWKLIYQKILCCIIYFSFSNLVFAQPQSYRYRIWVPASAIIWNDAVTPGGNSVTLPAATAVTTEKKYSIGQVEYTAETVTNYPSGTTVIADLEAPAQFTNQGAWANLSFDKTDRSKIHVNYWLNAPGTSSVTDYYIQLQNRDYVKYWYISYDLGPITIPFKYRPAFNKNNQWITDAFDTDLSLGLYGGFTFGQVTYSYFRNEEREPKKWMVSIGPFWGFSTINLDSISTSSSIEPLTEKRSIGVISAGAAVMTSIHDFRLGFFIGTDNAVGSIRNKWNYNNKFWFGFGIGYNIGLLWKKS